MPHRSLHPSPAAPPQTQTPSNAYFLCLQHQDEPIAWNPFTERRVVNEHTAYFGGVFEAMERHLDVSGLTVYLTWRLDELPRYGEDVVAVVMGDEWGRYPPYANRVRAIFKMLGTDYDLEAHPLRTPLQLMAVTAAKYVRTQPLRLPYLLQQWRDRWRGPSWTDGAPVPVHNIPVGYADQDDLPLKPLDERAYDLYFSGSVSNQEFPWYTPQHWLRTPKDVARTQLIEAMQTLRDRRPGAQVEIDARLSYMPQRRRSGADVVEERSYSEMMMDTRICPVPRGTRIETPRLYEAMRYGCVIVTEPLPDRWYTRGLPALILHDWADLPDVAAALLDDPDRMQALHQQALAWWRSVCSEAPVGRFMADKINAAFHRS